MAFTRTDFRQFFDDIQMIRRRKEFTGTWKEHLKGGLGLRKVENALSVKRKEYDHLYTNIFRKYGIVPDDLYSDLDRMWNAAIESSNEIFSRFTTTTVPFATATNMAYREFWKKYVDATIDHARKKGEGELKDG